MGHWDRDRYLAERARLEALLEELAAELQSTEAPLLPLGGLVEGWHTGDRQARHDLLAAFFDELDVLDGEIVAVVPRADRAAEVVSLLEKACAQYCPGSPGGIRGDTYDGVQEPLLLTTGRVLCGAEHPGHTAQERYSWADQDGVQP
jgi:hypothetical protein